MLALVQRHQFSMQFKTKSLRGANDSRASDNVQL